MPVFEPDLNPLAASRKRRLEESEAGEEVREVAQGQMKDEDEVVGKESKFVTGVPLTSMPGHTGYLTFATLPSS